MTGSFFLRKERSQGGISCGQYHFSIFRNAIICMFDEIIYLPMGGQNI